MIVGITKVNNQPKYDGRNGQECHCQFRAEFRCEIAKGQIAAKPANAIDGSNP